MGALSSTAQCVCEDGYFELGTVVQQSTPYGRDELILCPANIEGREIYPPPCVPDFGLQILVEVLWSVEDVNLISVDVNPWSETVQV